jgi:hypothetical protein
VGEDVISGVDSTVVVSAEAVGWVVIFSAVELQPNTVTTIAREVTNKVNRRAQFMLSPVQIR